MVLRALMGLTRGLEGLLRSQGVRKAVLVVVAVILVLGKVGNSLNSQINTSKLAKMQTNKTVPAFSRVCRPFSLHQSKDT